MNGSSSLYSSESGIEPLTPFDYLFPPIIIFVIGPLGSLLPTAMTKFCCKGKDFDVNCSHIFRFFNGLSAGVVLAVGIVHSIVDAFESWEGAMTEFLGSDEPSSAQEYPWPAFITMMGIIVTYSVDEFLHGRLEDREQDQEDHKQGHVGSADTHFHNHLGGESKERGGSSGNFDKISDKLVAESSPTTASSSSSYTDDESSPADSESEEEEEEDEEEEEESSSHAHSHHHKKKKKKSKHSHGHKQKSVPLTKAKHGHGHGGKHSHGHGTADDLSSLASLATMLFGLSFHSLFVGLALGLEGKDNVPLLVAILFHQFFEGLALGSRVVRAQFDRQWKHVLVHIIFALAAPIGVSVGLILRSSLTDPITLGFVNGACQGISAGVLIFVSIVHMIIEELARPEFAAVKGLKASLYVGFLVGAAALCVIGIWA